MGRLIYFFAIAVLTISIAASMSSENYKIEGLGTSSGGVNTSSAEHIANFIVGILSGEIFSAIHVADIGFFHSSSESIPPCVPIWFRPEWEDVVCNGTHKSRTWTDSVPCDLDNISWVEIIPCCLENWTCTDWTTCEGGSQSRTCNETNICDAENVNKTEFQNCSIEEKSSSSSGGGGSSTIVPIKTVNETTNMSLITMYPNETTNILINNTDFGLTKVSINVREMVKGAFIIEEIENLSQSSIDLGLGLDFQIYEVFTVDKIIITNDKIKNVTLHFKATKVWLKEHLDGSMNLAEKLFKIYKRENDFDNWKNINVTFLYSNDDYYYYSVEALGFSTFVTGLDKSEICHGEQSRCRRDDIQRCGNESLWEIVEDCEFGCKDNECIKLIDKVINIMTIILAGLVVLLIMLLIIYRKFYAPRKIKRAN
ncbi:hypothetical protein KAS08_01085 [Candidatus Pacearchaeota archaeon]|nr:hypothetical protein [Candidatus Pacearchaeota archaeon]